MNGIKTPSWRVTRHRPPRTKHKHEWFYCPFLLKNLAKRFTCTCFKTELWNFRKWRIDCFQAEESFFQHNVTYLLSVWCAQKIWTLNLSDSLYTRAIPNQHGSDGDDEDGPNIVAPSLREMFSAAMVTQPLGYYSNSGEQHHQSSPNEGTSHAATTGSNKEKGKKKKKKKTKGTLLFATGAQRKY